MDGGELPGGILYDKIVEFEPGNEEYLIRRTYHLYKIDLAGEIED